MSPLEAVGAAVLLFWALLVLVAVVADLRRRWEARATRHHVHYRNVFGERSCGARRGLATVFSAEVDCPACLRRMPRRLTEGRDR